jgi:hypothetical protein
MPCKVKQGGRPYLTFAGAVNVTGQFKPPSSYRIKTSYFYDDCGSTGGFDTEVGGNSLHGLRYFEQRFDALKRKYSLKPSGMKTKKNRGA